MSIIYFDMQVSKWGNSLAVRLPVALVRALGLSAGDEILLQPATKRTNQPLRVTVVRLPGKLEQLQAARKYRAPWPADYYFDRDDANAPDRPGLDGPL